MISHDLYSYVNSLQLSTAELPLLITEGSDSE